MATLTKQRIAQNGLAPTFVAAAGGGDKVRVRDEPDSGGRTFLVVKNGSGASVTVTLDDPNSSAPVGALQFNPDVAVAVPAGAERWIGPLSDGRFTNDSDGLVAWTYSAVTSVTVAVMTIG